jgi:lactoylglutathione lyase
MAASRQFYTGLLGFQEPFSWNKPDGSLMLTYFKVNDHQYIEVSPELKDPKEDRLTDIAFETTGAEQLRAYLASNGVKVPDKVDREDDGSLGFDVIDPDSHEVEFVQYVPGSRLEKQFGKYLPESRISQHMIHVGITVKDRDAADHFYRDILGFKQTWYGGMTDTRTDWVDMRVPEGTDWLEYMLNVHDPDPRVLGIMHHFALGTPSVAASYQILLKRGLKTTEAPKIGRDGKWQLNLYDPNLTRVEMMEPAPVRKPCCSAVNTN